MHSPFVPSANLWRYVRQCLSDPIKISDGANIKIKYYLFIWLFSFQIQIRINNFFPLEEKVWKPHPYFLILKKRVTAYIYN